MAPELAREIYEDPQVIERKGSFFPESSNDNGMHQVVVGLLLVVFKQPTPHPQPMVKSNKEWVNKPAN